MKQLTETAMFRQLSTGEALKSNEAVLKTIYEDFAHAVVEICTCEQRDIPAYFTLDYTRSEFDQLTFAASTQGSGKKHFKSYLISSLIYRLCP